MVRTNIRRFTDDDRGATAVEYVAIAFMVSIVIIAGSTAIGTKLSNLYFGPLIGNF